MIDPDDVMLEVSQRPGPGQQMCPNPDGALGAFWWTTPLPTSFIQTIDATPWGKATALAYTSTAEGSQSWSSIPFPCDRSAGLNPYAYVTVLPSSSEPVSAWFSGYDAAGQLLGSTATMTIPGVSSPTVVTINPAGTLPAATTQVRLRIGWAAAAGGPQLVLTDIKVTTGTSLPSAASITAPSWSSIGGQASSVTCTSAGVEPGTLTATFHDPWLDPAAIPLLVPGAAVRFSAGYQSDRLWTGTIASARTEYRKVRKAGVERRPTITVNAVDAIAQLAATPSPRGVGPAGGNNPQFMFEAAGVPWSINGYTGQSGEPTTTYDTPGASALDHLVLYRDTPLTVPYRVWVDQFGVLQISYLTPTEIGTPFSDSATAARSYVEIEAGFDPEECINSVTVRDLGGSHGPFTAPASVQKWGPRHAEVCIYDPGLTSNEAATFAGRVLAANATPVPRVRSIAINVETLSEQTLAAHYRIGRKITVHYSGATYVCRIDRVTHTLTAHRDVRRPATWRVDLALSPYDTRPMPLSAAFPS